MFISQQLEYWVIYSIFYGIIIIIIIFFFLDIFNRNLISFVFTISGL